MKKIFFIIFIFVIQNFHAQEVDSSFAAPADTLLQNSSDTTKSSNKIDVDAVVYASASDSLTFDVQNKKMAIYGEGELKYKQTDLTGANINIDFINNRLDATGERDSTDNLVNTPVLNEDGTGYEGSSLKYNFKTKQGFISLAESKDEGATYRGKKVKKVNENTYFIEDGIYTTCDADSGLPDTYFTAKKMKVVQNSQIAAQWIWMYIGGVPLPLPLPFGVFPNESGRRSGIIAPSYGQSQNQGFYFRNFGYYFALSDYYDLTLNGDYYLRGGYGLRSRVRYAKRYSFSGNINAGYSDFYFGEENDDDRSERTEWNFGLIHNQQINPSTRLDVNLRFLSSDYIKNNSTNYNDLLNQNITSSANFHKSWEGGKSLSLSYLRNQDLDNGNITENLPSASFNKSQSYPFRREGVSQSDQKWFELIGYSYNGRFLNRRNKTGGNLETHGGFQHDISINASPKFGYFNVTPSANYSEKWYNKRLKIDNIPVTDTTQESGLRDSLVTNSIKEINFVRTFNFNLSTNTKLYGTWRPNILGVDAFRHTLTPSVSYNIRPDFSEDRWGYFDTYRSWDGEIVKYDKFREEAFGGASSGESQSLNFSLGNIFEIKTSEDPTDTTSESQKIQLLNLNAGLGYNFAADSLRLSDLNLSFRTQVADIFTFNGSSRYSFYEYSKSKQRVVDQYLYKNGGGLFELTNLSFSFSTSISGDKIRSEDRTGDETGDVEEDAFETFRRSEYIALYEDEQPNFSIPWSLNLSYNFNQNFRGAGKNKLSNLSMNLNMNLTENWKITFRGSYDLIENELAAPQITVYRDLHCWEANFVWNPLGTFSGFRFEIRLKAPQLRDIKVSRTEGLYTGRR